MNNKIYISIFSLFIAGLIIGTTPFTARAEEELPPAGLTPDSAFYFLDSWSEQLSLFFTFGSEKKATKALAYTQEKLAELEQLSAENKTAVMEKALGKYNQYYTLAQNTIGKIKTEGINVDQLNQKMTQTASRHQETLAKVYENAPEQAKQGLEQAMEKSQQGLLKNIETLQLGEAQTQFKNKMEQGGVSPEKEAQITRAQNEMQKMLGNMQGIMRGGVTPEEWTVIQNELIKLIDLIETTITAGASTEQQEQIFAALDQITEIIQTSNLSDSGKTQSLNLIYEIESTIKEGLTMTEKLAINLALEQLKQIIINTPAPNAEQAQQKIQEGSLQEQLSEQLNKFKGMGGKSDSE